MMKTYVLLVVAGVVWAKTDLHRSNKLANDIMQIDTITTTEKMVLLPDQIIPQKPIFMRRDKQSTMQTRIVRSRLIPWGDIKATVTDGFFIPVVQPLGNLTEIPAFPQPQERLDVGWNILGDEENLYVMQRTKNPDSAEGKSKKDIQDKSIMEENKINSSPVDIPVMCGNYKIKAGEEVVIQTPYYPLKYTNNFRCRWTFTILDNNVTHINCPNFKLAKGDYLQIDNGNVKEATRYSLNKGPVNETTNKETLRLLFASNKRRNDQGFSCRVTVQGRETTTTTTTTSTTTKPVATTTTSTTTTERPPTTTTSQTTTTSLPPLSHPDCGIANRNRIVNGQSATANEYPWQAFLEIKWSDGKNQLCGGSIITNSWILTAGHCVQRKKDGKLWLPTVKVTLGMHTRTEPLSNGGYTLTAAQIVIHPKEDFAYDLALIELSKNVTYKDEIRPICLPNRSALGRNVTGVPMALIGWGKTETGQLTNELRELPRLGIGAVVCRKVFGSYITDHHFCTNGIGVKHICLGDSGGPVMTMDKGRFTLTGVVSFVATADCKGEFPDGHTSVVHFLDWLEEVTGKKFQ